MPPGEIDPRAESCRCGVPQAIAKFPLGCTEQAWRGWQCSICKHIWPLWKAPITLPTSISHQVADQVGKHQQPGRAGDRRLGKV
jgi:hypothetical protein